MTLQEIFIKVALFFLIFYGALLLTSFLRKRFKQAKPKEEKEESSEKKKE